VFTSCTRSVIQHWSLRQRRHYAAKVDEASQAGLDYSNRGGITADIGSDPIKMIVAS
jgi:hypothetical protein